MSHEPSDCPLQSKTYSTSWLLLAQSTLLVLNKNVAMVNSLRTGTQWKFGTRIRGALCVALLTHLTSRSNCVVPTVTTTDFITLPETREETFRSRECKSSVAVKTIAIRCDQHGAVSHRVVARKCRRRSPACRQGSLTLNTSFLTRVLNIYRSRYVERAILLQRSKIGIGLSSVNVPV